MKKLLAVFGLPLLLATGIMFAEAQTTTTNANCLILTHDMGIGATDATTGGEVTKLQNFLIGRSFMRLKSATTTLGTYGSQTANGVSQFQRAYGILSSGYAGPITRSNIQTLTCAIGAVDTSSLPTTTISTSSLSLLTFTSPVAGALIVKGEKDITPDWTVSSGAKTAFASALSFASIKLELLDSTGAVVGTIGNNTKLSSRNNNKVENNFVRVLKTNGRKDNIVDPGQYRLRASLVYSGTDAALSSLASQYASESGWFTVVNPAPKPEIKISASTTTLTVSAPVTITWTATASSTGCTFTDVAASTSMSVSPSGSQVVTPTGTSSTYRIACSLTSAWPLPGMTYTTSAQKGVTITIGRTQVCNSEQTSTATGCVNITKPFTCADGRVVQIPGLLSVTDSNRASIEAQYCGTDSSATTTTNYNLPTIAATANGMSIVNNARILVAPMTTTINLAWNTTGNPTCTYNGVSIAQNGTKIETIGNHGYRFVCTNSVGSTTLSFRVDTDTGTSSGSGGSSSTLMEPNFSATCFQTTQGKYKITLKWEPVSGAKNYPVRLEGPSFATNAVQFNGSSVVGFNNPSVVDNPKAPTGKSYTFEGLSATGTYSYWGHAWAPSTTEAGGTWSTHTKKQVMCPSRVSDLGTSGLATLDEPEVLGAATQCIDLGVNMHRGYEIPAVSKLQSFLKSKDLLSEVTGFYGDKTVAAVKMYQESRGLPMTGMVYGATRAAILSDTCQ